MLWKKGNERFALLIVAVVAVFGLFLMWQNAGDVTGFAAKKATAKAPPPETRTCVDSDGGRVLDVKGFVSGEYVNGKAYRFDDKCTSRGIVEYTCKDPTQMGVSQTSCPRGSRCQDGACVSLCGNGRVDPTENCGTCLADAPCGADEVCQNNACASRFFCRETAYGSVETEQGVSRSSCDSASAVTTLFNCGGYDRTHQVNSSQQNCGGQGCAPGPVEGAGALCCNQPGRSFFVCDANGARVNQTTSACDGQVRSSPATCSANVPYCLSNVTGNATCSGPYCRYVPGSWTSVETQNGIFGPTCDPAIGNFTHGYSCSGAVARPNSEICGLGCNATMNGCCTQVSERSARCEGRTLVNETVSACDGQRRVMRYSCEQVSGRNPAGQWGTYPGNCIASDESNSAVCAVCGMRVCFGSADPRQAFFNHIRPEEQCGAGSRDLGIVQC